MTGSRGIYTTYWGNSGTEYTAHSTWPVTKITVTMSQAMKSLNHPVLLSIFASEVAQAIGFFQPEESVDIAAFDIAAIQFEIVFSG